MTRLEVIDQVATLVATTTQVLPQSVDVEGLLVENGVDSVKALDLIMAIEDAFDMELSEDDPELASVQTVRDLGELVYRRKGLS